MARVLTFRTMVVGIAVAMIAAVWIGYAHMTRTVYAQQRADALLNAESIAGTFAKSAHQTVHEIDNFLKIVGAEFTESGFEHAAIFIEKAFFDADLIHHFLMVDEEGYPVYRSAGGLPPGTAAGRPQFEALKSGRVHGLLIDTPRRLPGSDRWLICMARRVEHPGGAFAGVAVAFVDAQHFVDFFPSVSIGTHGSLNLVGLDGVIRARASRDGDAGVGKTLPKSNLWPALETEVEGVYRQTSAVDGRERHYAYRRLTEHPLVVTVGVAEEDIVASAAGVVWNLRVIAVLLTLCTAIAAAFALAQRRTADRLRAALGLNRDFLARVSHELRTPLNAILGFSEIIKDRLLGPDATDRYAEYARDIHGAGQQLLGLVDDVLDLSNLQAGKVALAPEAVEVRPAIDWAIRVLAPQAEAKGIHMEAAVEPAVTTITADHRALRQMLLNLLSNAVKFTPEGGRILVVAARERDGRCSLRVCDTGVGMTPEQVRQAAVPFGQESAHTARAGQGRGLGLAIVKALIEAQGGRLSIDSRPGEGSRVTLEFA